MAVTEREQRRIAARRQVTPQTTIAARGAGERKTAMTTTMLCILLSTACGVTGQLVLKKAMTNIGFLTPSLGAVPTIMLKIATSPLVIGGMACYVLGSFFWLIALSRVQLSFAYPFASLSYVLVFAAAWYFYGETISAWRLAGVAVICLGVLLISRS